MSSPGNSFVCWSIVYWIGLGNHIPCWYSYPAAESRGLVGSGHGRNDQGNCAA